MYQSFHTKPKAQTKRRSLVMLVLVGACCMALGLYGLETVAEQPIRDEAIHAHLTSLVDTHKYAMEQNRQLGVLIEQGVENQVAVVGAIAAIKGAAAFAAANPALVSGVASIFKNVVWGGDVARTTVDPAKIDASFDNSKTFAAEI